MKFTLITGASSGIGESFACAYAKKGKSLILVSRSEGRLRDLASKLSKTYCVSIHTITQDLSNPNSAEDLLYAINKLGIEVDLIINNAGFGLIGDFEYQDISKIQDMIFLNILTLTKITYFLLPQIKKNRGGIINVASHAAFQPIPYAAAYAASKSYVLNFTQAISEELAGNNLKIMALCPGATRTAFFTTANHSLEKTRFKSLSAEEVVIEAISAFEKGKPVLVTGWLNKFLTFALRFSTQKLTFKGSKYLMNYY